MINPLDDPSKDNLKWVRAYSELNEEVCQILGKALGYPWFKDDQENFPGATEEHGVCVGEHVASSIAEEAASKIVELKAKIVQLERKITLAERQQATDHNYGTSC